jgi:dTDP-glucose pyrophosphorylase
MLNDNRPRAIIPCAGFGTRMGMKNDESKEMLIDPGTGKPIIDWCLDLCQQFDLLPKILVREEKKDLIEHVKSRGAEVCRVQLRGRDWADTIVTGWSHHTRNILLLPDTRFDNPGAIEQILTHLTLGTMMVLGIHTVPDPENWGIVAHYKVFEKPKSIKSKIAWGVIGYNGFCPSAHMFFRDINDMKIGALYNASFVELQNFRDITRAGKL